VVDVEQVVVGGMLLLGISVRAPETESAALTAGLSDAMGEKGQRLETTPGRLAAKDNTSTHVVVVLGSPVTAAAFSAIAGATASIDANIDAIRSIADYPVTGIELTVTTASDTEADDATLRQTLAPLAEAHGVDLA